MKKLAINGLPVSVAIYTETGLSDSQKASPIQKPINAPMRPFKAKILKGTARNPQALVCPGVPGIRL